MSLTRLRFDSLSRRYRRGLASGLLLVLVCGAQELAARDEPEGIRGARLPHSNLPAGATDHGAELVNDYCDDFWKSSGVTPAPAIDDSTFLRRASLALHGVPATADEVRQFLASEAPDKRAAKVDELLVGSRYADYWGFRLRAWIVDMREILGQSTNIATIYFYTREAMAENRSWARIARDLVATEGEITFQGWANFPLYFDGEANEIAEAASRLFLGINLACSQCHDHPYTDSLTQEGYWGFAAYFPRIKILYPEAIGRDNYTKRFPDVGRRPAAVSTLPGGDYGIDGEWGDERAIVDIDKGEVKLPDPKESRTINPTPLGGAPVEDPDGKEITRREQAAAWIIDPKNPYFARAAVNRFWLELTGLGFVDRFDGFVPGGPIRHQKLLDRLAEQFVAHDHDVKWLIRTILLSRVFQLGYGDEPQAHETWQCLSLRPLNGDQWHDSVLRVTGEEDRIYSLAEEIAPLLDEDQRKRVELHGAVEKQDSPSRDPVASVGTLPSLERERLEKLRQDYIAIGRDLRESRIRARLPTSAANEALMRMNSDLVATSLSQGFAVEEIARLRTPAERLDGLYLGVLGRLPDESERQKFQAEVRNPGRERVADMMWVLLQSTEFRTY